MEPAAIKEILAIIGQIGSPAAAVLLSFKLMLNGLATDVKEIKTDVKEIRQKQAFHHTRLSVLEHETKVHPTIDD